MNIYTFVSLLLFSSFLSASQFSCDTKAETAHLKFYLDKFEPSSVSALEKDDLMAKLRSLNALLITATEAFIFLDQNIESRFSSIYGIIIDIIVPDVLRFKAEKDLLAFTKGLIVLKSIKRGEWSWNSRTCFKASQLLHTCAEINQDLQLVYDDTQYDLIKKMELEDVLVLMNYFVLKLQISNILIPRLIFDNESCGVLTFEMKCDTLKRIFKKIIVIYDLAKTNPSSIQVDVSFGTSAISHVVFNDLDDSFLKSAYEIVMFTAVYTLPKFDMTIMFNMVDHALMNRTGHSVNYVLDLLFEPNFALRIVDKWINLPLKHIKIWEKAVIYLSTKNEEYFSKVLLALEEPYKGLCVLTYKKLSTKIDLLRRAIKLFDCECTKSSQIRKCFENEIDLLFAIYEEKLCDVPRETHLKINHRLAESQKLYLSATCDLQVFALVLSALVYTKQPVDEQLPTSFYTYTILNSTFIKEIRPEWEEKFETIMREQVPRIAKIISESSIEMKPENLAKFVKVFLKYAPNRAVEVIVSAIRASPNPELMLDAIADHEELYQVVLVECLLKGVHLDHLQINCCSTISLIIKRV
jgi:hypothetical protein